MEHNNIPAEYRPISMWGYFGYQLLFSIPVVGFIMLIICSFSRNINKRNFARSYFCDHLHSHLCSTPRNRISCAGNQFLNGNISVTLFAQCRQGLRRDRSCR